MEVNPSPKAWRRLERKLDTHRHRGRRNVQRLMALAAAFLLLIIFVLVFSMVLGTMEGDRMAYNEAAPVQLEDLVTTDIDLEAYRVVSFTHHLRDRMAAPISEGGADRKLVPTGVSAAEAGLNAIPREQKAAQLSEFNWLLGRWQGKAAGGKKSVENWQRLNNQNLRGEGIIVQKRDTTFRETILLEDNGEELVLWVQLAERGRSYPFALKRYEAGKAVFVNPDMTFPQEIHLERNGTDQYSIVYVNAGMSDLTAEQSNFLQQRNAVSLQQVRRTLRR